MGGREVRADRALLATGAAVAALDVLGLGWVAVADRRLSAAAPMHADGQGDVWTSTLSVWIVLAAALLIVVQQRRHPVGWLLLSFGTLAGVEAVAEQLALAGLYDPHSAVRGAAVWADLSEAVQRPQAGLIFAVLLVFPTGRLLSRRWRPLLWALGAVFAFWFVLALFSPAPLQEDPFRGLANPLGSSLFANATLRHAMTPLAAVVGLGCLASLVLRYRLSSGDERQQLRWVGLGAGLLPVCLAAVAVASAFGPAARNAVGDSVWVVLGLVLPVVVVVAITRYRLYDLDLLVNRAVAYGLLSALVLAIYAATVLVATRVVVGVTSRSPVVVGVATLAAALVIAPAHRRLQAPLDRVFRRREWTAREQIRAFAVRALDEPQPPEALRDLLARVCGDPSLQLGFWLRARGGYVGVDGSSLALPTGPDRTVVEVAGPANQPVAVLVHAPVLARDRRLWATVLAALGLLLENGRLQAELLAQVVEVQASRARIVTSADAERRRVERDLHDGAQQRLLGVALQLRLVRRRLGPDEPTGQALDDIGAEVQAAIAELRDLARGIHPAALDQGLGPALESMAGRLPIDVAIEVSAPRVAPLIELTAYYVACEAVANAVKHASAASLAVRAAHRDGMLLLDICDDGRGGASPTAGSGLAGLLDRVAAVGGRLRIESPPGHGTTVTAVLPCGC